MKKEKTKKIILIIIQIILICCIIFSGYKIITWYVHNKKTEDTLIEIKEFVEEESDNETLNVDFTSLKELNNQTVAYIKIDLLNLEYPVVQTTNNDYYLNRSYDKSYNTAGWIFADYRNKLDETDKNTIIYGHNRLDGSMFGSLSNIIDNELYNEDNKIQLINEENTYEYEIFSIYEIVAEEYYLTTNFSDNQYDKFLTTIKNRSIHNYNINLTNEDKIITLSTCTTSDDKRLVIHAKLIK